MRKSVFAVAGNNMGVRVIHELTGSSEVIHQYVDPVRLGCFFHYAGYSLHFLHELSRYFFGKIEKVFVVTFWDYESVAQVHRVNVEKGKKLTRFRHLVGRDFARNDFAKDAVGIHVATIPHLVYWGTKAKVVYSSMQTPSAEKPQGNSYARPYGLRSILEYAEVFVCYGRYTLTRSESKQEGVVNMSRRPTRPSMGIFAYKNIRVFSTPYGFATELLLSF